MCYVETEENAETPLTVIEYISMDLKQDELQFHNPLHRKILAEAESHLHDQNFTAERYFLAHPDPTISRLAAEMINDRYQLSKYHSKSQKIITDEERLHELVPHQIIDFKLAILEEEMDHTRRQQMLGNYGSLQRLERTIERDGQTCRRPGGTQSIGFHLSQEDCANMKCLSFGRRDRLNPHENDLPHAFGQI